MSTLESLSQCFPGVNAITRTQFREFIGISASTDWRAMKAGRYPKIIKIGNHEKILLKDLATFLDAGGSSGGKKRGRPVGSKNKKASHAPA